MKKKPFLDKHLSFKLCIFKINRNRTKEGDYFEGEAIHTQCAHNFAIHTHNICTLIFIKKKSGILRINDNKIDKIDNDNK